MKTTHVAAYFVCFLALNGAVAAETPDSNTGNQSTVQLKRKQLALDSVQFTDKTISKAVRIESVYAERTATGTTQITVRFINTTDRFVQLEGRSMFMDHDRKPVEGLSAWKTVYLPPNSFGIYDALSISAADTEHFLIEVRGTDRS